MLKNKFLISAIVLALATSSVFDPILTLGGLGIGLAFFAFYNFPNFGLITAILATTLGEFGRIEFGGISFLALDLIAPAVLGLWFVRKLVRQEKIILDRTSGTLLLFWLVAGLSLLIGAQEISSGELQTAALHLFRFVSISGLFLIARDIRRVPSSEFRVPSSEIQNTKYQILNTILLSILLLAVSGFYLLQVMPDFAEAGLTKLGFDPHIDRLTGTWLDPNFAAGAFAFLLPFLAALILATRKIGRQFLLTLGAGILLIALLFTYSRSGLLAFSAGMFVFGLLRSRTLLIALVLVAFLGIGVSERLQSRLGELAQSVTSLGETSQQVLDPTANLRFVSWNEGMRIFREHPFLGVGFNAYAAHQNFTSTESHAATGSDSSLLNVAAMTGSVGLLIFLVLLGNIFRDAWSNRRNPLALGALSGISGLLVHSLFVNSLFFPPLTLFLFVVAGMVEQKKTPR